MVDEVLMLAILGELVDRELEEARKRIHDEFVNRLVLIRELQGKTLATEPKPRTIYTFIPIGGGEEKTLVELI
jgi:hypothetical protein